MKSIRMKPQGLESSGRTKEFLKNNEIWCKTYTPTHTCLHISLDLNIDNLELLEALKTNTTIKELSIGFDNFYNSDEDEAASDDEEVINADIVFESLDEAEAASDDEEVSVITLASKSHDKTEATKILEALSDKTIDYLSIAVSYTHLTLPTIYSV